MTFSSLEALEAGVSRLVDPEAVLADDDCVVVGKARGKGSELIDIVALI